MAIQRTVAIPGLALALIVACADEGGGGGVETAFSQTVPRPATAVDPFAFARELTVDWSTRIDAVRLTVAGGTLDAIERIDIRLVTANESMPVMDVFDPSLSAGASVQRVAVPSVTAADFAGYAAHDDYDGDLVDNADDNCPEIQNATQTDGDRDGVGAACDADDTDALTGPGSPDSGLPPVEVEVRVFADPDNVPDAGFVLTLTLLGQGTMEFVQ